MIRIILFVTLDGFIKLFIFRDFNFSIASIEEIFWKKDHPIAFLLKTSVRTGRSSTS